MPIWENLILGGMGFYREKMVLMNYPTSYNVHLLSFRVPSTQCPKGSANLLRSAGFSESSSHFLPAAVANTTAADAATAASAAATHAAADAAANAFANAAITAAIPHPTINTSSAAKQLGLHSAPWCEAEGWGRDVFANPKGHRKPRSQGEIRHPQSLENSPMCLGCTQWSIRSCPFPNG